MMAINKSTGKTKCSWVFNKKSVRKTVDTETNNLTLLPFVYKDWCTSEAHNRAKKKKFLVSITYSVMLSCSLIIDI